MQADNHFNDLGALWVSHSAVRAGVEWDALAQHQEACIRMEQSKLRTLGGLSATPLLPSLCHQAFKARQRIRHA
jgi:hypothetical protein